jgi:hypothetical protein
VDVSLCLQSSSWSVCEQGCPAEKLDIVLIARLLDSVLPWAEHGVERTVDTVSRIQYKEITFSMISVSSLLYIAALSHALSQFPCHLHAGTQHKRQYREKKGTF